MKVLGIDVGLHKTGYAVVDDKFTLLNYGVITTDKNKSLPIRLKELYEEMKKIIDNYIPDVAVCETLFSNKNPKTLSLMAHARGVLLLAAQEKGIMIEEYTPAEIKKRITGKGNAEKPQVRYMVNKLMKKEIPKSEDISDAIACTLYYFLK